jgi:hypothetical protein
MKFTSGSRSKVLEMVVDELATAKNSGSEGAFVFIPELGRVNVVFDPQKAAQQSVHLTALWRGLAASILLNVVLLAVVAFIIGGN